MYSCLLWKFRSIGTMGVTFYITLVNAFFLYFPHPLLPILSFLPTPLVKDGVRKSSPYVQLGPEIKLFRATVQTLLYVTDQLH